MFIQEYLPILLFIIIGIVFAGVFISLGFLRGKRNVYQQKILPYECGFDPFNNARVRFDIRYYLVAILFIIFDLEIAFLFPWSISLGEISWPGFLSMMVFIFILTVGFIYEWKKGALDWD